MSQVAHYRLDSARVQHEPAATPGMPGVEHRLGGVVPCSGPGDTAAARYLGGEGSRSIVEAPDDGTFSITTTGRLSLALLCRPDTAIFAGEGSSGSYVHLTHKAGEWGIRLGSSDSDRPGHLSCYAFNPEGGFGAGARWAAQLPVSDWSHVAAVYDLVIGRIALYVDGNEAGAGERSFVYHRGLPDEVRVWPRASRSPISLGGRIGGADFLGALADLRIYDHALTAAEVIDLAEGAA